MSKFGDFVDLARKGGVYTHSGHYHADDVFACAIAVLATGDWDLKLVHRVNSPEDLKRLGVNDSNSIVLDIGYGRFDHHQEKQEIYKQYPGKIRKSTVAKLWDYIGLDLVSVVETTMLSWAWQKAFETVERDLICKISDTDTRGLRARPDVICQMVEDMTRSYIPFGLAVKTAALILKSRIKTAFQNAVNKKQARKLADQWKSEGHPSWGFTEKFVPADAFYEITEVKFLTGKSERGGYNIACVDPEKFPIPQDLKAKRKGLYWANFNSKETALAAVEKIAVSYGLQDRIKIANQKAKKTRPLMTIDHDGIVKVDIQVFKERFGIDPIDLTKKLMFNICTDQEISKYIQRKE